MATQKKELVHAITVTFHDRSKIEFYGLIKEIKFEKGQLVRFSWRNAAYTEQGSLTSKRLRYIDITKIRSVVECCKGTKQEFDSEEFEVSAT